MEMDKNPSVGDKSIAEDLDEEKTNNLDQKTASEQPDVRNWPNRIIALTAIGTLIATCVLAFFTYRSLDEVKKQRDLTYKQFVMANRPNVNVDLGPHGGGLSFNENRGYIQWRIGNDGGDVQDLQYQVVLFHMKSETASDFSVEELYVRNLQQKNLNKGMRNLIRNSIDNPKTLQRLSDILAANEKSDRIGLYLKVEYTIPSELTLDGTARKDNRVYVLAWSKTSKSFELIKPLFFQIIMNKFSPKQFSVNEDRG